MILRIRNLRLDLDADPSRLAGLAAERLGVTADRLGPWRVARRSVDARGGRPRLIFSVDVEVDPATARRMAGADAAPVDESQGRPPVIDSGHAEIRGRVVVVGCGPAGIMAAIRLAENGYRPLVIERGRRVADRVADVGRFLRGGDLDRDSNLLFGAGGAGTFSDGKLSARSNDPRVHEVLCRLAEAGAPPDILYDARPHVGTDKLRAVVEMLCRRLTASGGEMRWGARLTGIRAERGEVRGIETSAGPIHTNAVILATGPYARDTFDALLSSGVALESKPFQMGLRIEHAQETIDRAVFEEYAGHPALGAAEYVLTHRGDRPVTSFCVCPGGTLLPAVAEPDAVCTNGMSCHRRDSGRCNGALIATLSPEEFGGTGPLAGLDLQRRFERAAASLGGGGFAAPAQAAPDFLKGLVRPIRVRTTYARGVRPALLDDVAPSAVISAIRAALPAFDRRIPGFAGPEAVLVGPEACASCPVRVLRDEGTRQSLSHAGLFPVGAGSGYAAGIMSSAVDGLASAEALIRTYAPPRL